MGADPPKTVISQPQKSKTTGQWTIFFSRRFEAPDGRLIGIVLSTILTDYFEQLFSGISLSDGSSFALFRNDGMRRWRRYARRWLATTARSTSSR